MKYFKSLDGIRGLTICFVITYHYLRLNGYNASVLGFSWVFIQMFFVQSGYLITSILLRSKDQSFALYAREFYWRRILRIFPVYFAYIGGFAVLYILYQKPPDFLNRLPYLLTFTYNYTRLLADLNFNSIWFIHFWSLSVEEQFYLVWPLLIYFMSKRTLQWLIGLLVLLVPVFRYLFAGYLLNQGYSNEMTGEIVYAFTFSQFDAFALGAAIPLFSLEGKITNPARWALVTLMLVLAAGAVNFSFIESVQPGFSLSSLGLSVARIDNLQHVWSYTLVNVLFLFVVMHLIRSGYRGIYNFPPFVAMGKVVYGMYIFHFVVLFAVFQVNQQYLNNLALSLLIAIGLTFTIAWVSYNHFEKKFLALKDWWINRS